MKAAEEGGSSRNGREIGRWKKEPVGTDEKEASRRKKQQE
jgi:hypothetical protein